MVMSSWKSRRRLIIQAFKKDQENTEPGNWIIQSGFHNDLFDGLLQFPFSYVDIASPPHWLWLIKYLHVHKDFTVCENLKQLR